jgi:aminoglycoside phosphotransferase (APT) family kinase protein
MDRERLKRFEAWLTREFGAPVKIESVERLTGGAIQENWKVAAQVSAGKHAGDHVWVVRTDAPSAVETSHSRADEFDLLRAAHDTGVLVARPRFLCHDRGVLGAPFFATDFVAGTAQARRIVRDPEIGTFGPLLARQLGRELGKLHAITPPRADLAFLGHPPDNAWEARIETYRGYLDAIGDPQPTLEWVMRLLQRNAPPGAGVVLCHGDFRTGNYMVDAGNLTAILDWEFAQWGDPYEDIGWFCANCWRFGQSQREAGGIAAKADFLNGYRETSGIEIDQTVVQSWEVMATVKWAVIALQQGQRYVAGNETSLELALTGRMVPEMELDLLVQTDRLAMENGRA